MTDNELRARVLLAKSRIKAATDTQVFPIYKLLFPDTQREEFTMHYSCRKVSAEFTIRLEQVAETIEKRML